MYHPEGSDKPQPFDGEAAADEADRREADRREVERREGWRRPERAQLGVISFGVALGLTWAVFVFLLSLAAGLLGWGVPVVSVLSTLYVGLEPSLVGCIAGAVWAAANGFVLGVVFAWLYNRVLGTRR